MSLIAVTFVSSKAPVYAFLEVRKGFVSVIFISLPVIFDCIFSPESVSDF